MDKEPNIQQKDMDPQSKFKSFQLKNIEPFYESFADICKI